MSTLQTKTIMEFVNNFFAEQMSCDCDRGVVVAEMIDEWNTKKPEFEALIKTQIKNKAPKTDPAKPKRATTTYQLYMANHRQEVVDDGFEQKEVMSELARRYNAEKEQENKNKLEKWRT